MYKWNEEKNSQLKRERGICFDDIVEALSRGEIVDNYKHPLSEKYPNQYIYVVLAREYIYYVPYVIAEDYLFLKTIIPSRKLNKKYNKES
jgi:uncharacterized DUF497 family protein